MAIRKMRKVSSWIEETKIENEHAEELLECRLIVLKIVRFMKNNHLSQKDLAERLNVSPQYINKFLHGQILDMKVSTILRYGKILGIKLIKVPEDDSLDGFNRATVIRSYSLRYEDSPRSLLNDYSNLTRLSLKKSVSSVLPMKTNQPFNS